MKRKLFILLAVVVAVCWASSAMANVVTFETPSGAQDSSHETVKAEVTFTTGANTLVINIANLQADPRSVGQNISDLSFVLNDPTLTTASLTSSSGLERTVADNGNFTDGSTVSTGWVLTGTGGATGFLLNGLGTATYKPVYTPAHTIIGPPNVVDGTYSNANNSIAGNGPHNPFLFGTEGSYVSFVLSIPGLNADDTVTAATFSFGTTPGDDVPGVVVPLPGSLLLLGSGLVPLAAYGWKKRKIAA